MTNQIYWVIKDSDGRVIPSTISYLRKMAIKRWLDVWEKPSMTKWGYWKRKGYSFAKVRIIEGCE